MKTASMYPFLSLSVPSRSDGLHTALFLSLVQDARPKLVCVSLRSLARRPHRPSGWSFVLARVRVCLSRGRVCVVCVVPPLHCAAGSWMPDEERVEGEGKGRGKAEGHADQPHGARRSKAMAWEPEQARSALRVFRCSCADVAVCLLTSRHVCPSLDAVSPGRTPSDQHCRYHAHAELTCRHAAAPAGGVTDTIEWTVDGTLLRSEAAAARAVDSGSLSSVRTDSLAGSVGVGRGDEWR